MGRRIAILVYSGEPACFVHALIKIYDLHSRSNDAIMILEGPAVTNIQKYSQEGDLFYRFYDNIRRANLITVCGDCAASQGVLEEAEKQKLHIIPNHPNSNHYSKMGFEVLRLVPRSCNFCETWDTVGFP